MVGYPVGGAPLAAAQAAWGTDRGQPIVAGVVAALRDEKIILPAPAVVERAAIAGRARARKRTADVLLAGVSGEQLAKLDRLLAVDPTPRATPLAWLRNTPVSPKADNIRELLDRLRSVRAIGLPADVASRPQFRGGDAAQFVQNCTLKAFSENS